MKSRPKSMLLRRDSHRREIDVLLPQQDRCSERSIALLIRLWVFGVASTEWDSPSKDHETTGDTKMSFNFSIIQSFDDSL
jgi:hypothetical protein